MNLRQSIAEGPIYGALGLTELDTRCGTPTRIRIPSVVLTLWFVYHRRLSEWPLYMAGETGIYINGFYNWIWPSAWHFITKSSTWLSPFIVMLHTCHIHIHIQIHGSIRGSWCQSASWARFAWRVIKNWDSQTTHTPTLWSGTTTWISAGIQSGFFPRKLNGTQHAQLEQESYEIIPTAIHLAHCRQIWQTKCNKLSIIFQNI